MILFCLVTWKLLRVDEDCWMQIPQGGRSLLSKITFCSASSDNRSLEQCQMNQENSNEGKAFLFQVMVYLSSSDHCPKVCWRSQVRQIGGLSHVSFHKATENHRNKHMSIIPGLSLLKALQEFWLKGNMTEICAAPPHLNNLCITTAWHWSTWVKILTRQLPCSQKKMLIDGKGQALSSPLSSVMSPTMHTFFSWLNINVQGLWDI